MRLANTLMLAIAATLWLVACDKGNGVPPPPKPTSQSPASSQLETRGAEFA